MTARANGFTLLELLVAMVAGALLLGVVSWTVAAAGQQLQVDGAARPTMLIAERTLAGMIERASVPSADQATFDGDARGFRILVPPPAALGAVGRVFLVIGTAPGAAGADLTARFEPAAGSAALPPYALEASTLIDGLRSVTFDYGPAQDADRPSLPTYIRINLRQQKGGSRALLFVPKLNSDGACRFDPISQVCK